VRPQPWYHRPACDSIMTDFLDLPDLACEAVGGAALACNDE
jgi:hypothetical protein